MKPNMVNLVARYSKRRGPVLLTQAVCFILLNSSGARADWQIKYDTFLLEVMRKNGHPIPSLYGHYATRAECVAAIKRAVAQSGDPYLERHMQPVGHDDPKPSVQPPTSTASPATREPDDRLYYDGIVTPGGLRTRHFEADGLPARAEEWGKEMRQFKDQSQKKQEARDQAFQTDKNTLLEKQGNGTALNQLKNPFADDPNVVDLRETTKPTPSIPPMGDKKESGSPIYEGDQNPLVALSDEQLEKKREALGKAISEIGKLQAAVTSGYADLESDAQAGMALAEKALVDVGATATFGISGEIGLKKAVELAEASVEIINLGDTLEKRSSDPSGVKDGDDFAQVLTIGSGFIKSGIGKAPGLVQSVIDTAFVLGTCGKLVLDSYQQKDLQEQHNANLQRLTLAQMQVIEEQNRRKRRAASK